MIELYRLQSKGWSQWSDNSHYPYAFLLNWIFSFSLVILESDHVKQPGEEEMKEKMKGFNTIVLF